MKIAFGIILWLCIVLLLAGLASALKCYKCKENQDDKCKDPIEKGKEKDNLDEISCDIPPLDKTNDTATTAAAAEGGDPPPEGGGERLQIQDLIERDEALAADPVNVDATMGCIKIKYTIDEKDKFIRGCGADGCEITKKVMKVNNGTCDFCKEDLCNSSFRTRPIKWVILLMMPSLLASIIIISQ